MAQTTKPSAAAQHVFNITELLENILSHLTPRDVLIAQRTARSFHHTVQGSLRLRRKVFFEPDWTLQTASQSYLVRNRMGNRPENNRMLLRAFPNLYPTITLVIVPEDRRHLRGDRDATAMQQMSFAQGPHGVGSSPVDTSEEWIWDVCISFPAKHRSDLSDAVLRPEASWRRMYLTQPPCKELYVVRQWTRSREPAVVRESGITMGDFYDEVTQRCKDHKWHPSYISSDGDWHFEGNIQCDSFLV